MKTIAELTPLVDMDILVYRCGFAADGEVKRAGYDPQDVDYLRNCLHIVNTTMDNKILRKLPSEYRGYISGQGNFRETAATIKPYKGNRDENAKPKYYKQIKEHLIDKYGAIVVHGREADDALGCDQWAAKDGSTIIVSIDKDLDMIPGHHYNWVKDRFYTRSLRNANLQIFAQMLNGDTTDNIPGIQGIGPITIRQVFKDLDYDMDKIRAYVQEQYKLQYGDRWKQAYEEVGLLLWIERVEGKPCPFLW
jgi:hypothetical protein